VQLFLLNSTTTQALRFDRDLAHLTYPMRQLMSSTTKSISQPKYDQIVEYCILKVFSRLDIIYALGKLSRYTQFPNQDH